MAGRTRGAAERWRQRVARWRLSGWTVAEFCQREGLSSPSFYVWRKRLRGSPGRQRRATAGAPRMVPVQLADPPSAWPAAAGGLGGAGAVEVALPGGVTIRAGAQVDEPRLRSVLRAVLAETVIAETAGC